MSELHDQLVALRDLMADPSHFTQGEFAKDAKGDFIFDPTDPDATCWCVYGAAAKISGTTVLTVTKDSVWRAPIGKALKKAVCDIRGLFDTPDLVVLPDINDGKEDLIPGLTGYPAIMLIIEKAIQNNA